MQISIFYDCELNKVAYGCLTLDQVKNSGTSFTFNQCVIKRYYNMGRGNYIVLQIFGLQCFACELRCILLDC